MERLARDAVLAGGKEGPDHGGQDADEEDTGQDDDLYGIDLARVQDHAHGGNVVAHESQTEPGQSEGQQGGYESRDAVLDDVEQIDLLHADTDETHEGDLLGGMVHIEQGDDRNDENVHY